MSAAQGDPGATFLDRFRALYDDLNAAQGDGDGFHYYAQAQLVRSCIRHEEHHVTKQPSLFTVRSDRAAQVEVVS